MAIVENFQDDNYMVKVDVTMNGGDDATIWVRRVDPENGYVLHLGSTGVISLGEMVNGSWSAGTLEAYTAKATRVRHKWLSRRRRAALFPWPRMNRLLERYPLPRAVVVHSVYRSAAKTVT